ncbi:MAG: DNA-formamidopyrimidine glycosylase [Clostridia bacterium]|nr:DNA-formamidopyrimidine glycosylase [Clostridia bacterium]
MPELPEVETVRTVLLPYVVGQKITDTTISLPKVLANISSQDFITKTKQRTITHFTRRGKFLTLHLDNAAFIVIHFRMTGTLTIEDKGTALDKHTHVILTFANQQQLRFIDSRGFGHWWYFEAGQSDTSGQLLLGPEPEQITFAYLKEKLTKRQTALKTLLLDQHIIAGIGNIYADEICFRTQIRPTRRGDSLSDTELQRLLDTIPTVIQEFIQIHRVPFDVYHQTKGTSYQKDTHRAVYGRKGQPCQKCGHPLQGTRIGQRSSVFCEHCQK